MQTSTSLPLTQGAEAIAEVFWLAFTRLSEPEKKAVLHRLSPSPLRRRKRPLNTAQIAHKLTGIVAWGGDALQDAEQLYAQ